MTSLDSFQTRSTLKVDNEEYEIFRLDALTRHGFKKIHELPYSLKILLENLLRCEDGKSVTKKDIEVLAQWDPKAEPSKEISFRPARVLLQDFTGVPAVVDLAAMRDALKKMGGDPTKINPLQPVDLVIDHSVQVDSFGRPDSLKINTELEFQRNQERYRFLRWGQQAFDNFRVVPPDTGIVHQVNLEYLAKVVFVNKIGRACDGKASAYPDTVVGTDSHTTMINGLGVLGWGVGGIEAEAAMLGQPISMLIPQVVGFKLIGKLPEGSTATDLVLTVTQMLRKKGVVGKFVEFYGPGLTVLSLPDRATLANMAPEYGATMGFFPVDEETLNYLKQTGRDQNVALVQKYCEEQGLFLTEKSANAVYSDTLELDLATVVPSLAGPKRPQDLVPLNTGKASFSKALVDLYKEKDPGKNISVEQNDQKFNLANGSVVIAAITSCTNTSNPQVMIAAGLVAKKAVEKGMYVQPWVKTSLAPGSRVVTEYLQKSGLSPYLDQLGFSLVGYGCTTCIGNSGPLPESISKGIHDKDLVAVSVLSGNRNFEGRINPDVKANYLTSPPLVVIYALAGRMDIDLYKEPLGKDKDGKPVFMKDLWPSLKEISQVISTSVADKMFTESYAEVFQGDENWRTLQVPKGGTFSWDSGSTYVKHPPFFEQMPEKPVAVQDLKGARALAVLGDSVTTDHISPAGSIPLDSPAGKYLIQQGVNPKDFNSFGSRRGNHEVMMRGTFGNIRLKNFLAPGSEGNVTVHLPDGAQMSIYDAAMLYKQEGVPLIVLAGQEYGSGSSRDWAAKGPKLLGVRAVIAQSFEKIHRSNLVGMGILPLQFEKGEDYKTLGLSGKELYDISGLATDLTIRKKLTVTAREGTQEKTFHVILRIDTPVELEYYRNGGILQFVLRQLKAA